MLQATVWFAVMAVPAAACPGAAGAAGGCAGGGLGGAALLAVVGALGWALLRFAAKEGGVLKNAGLVAGWILLVGGVGGFLCGALYHALSHRDRSQACRHGPASWGAGGEKAGSPMLPLGHPPLEAPSPRK